MDVQGIPTAQLLLVSSCQWQQDHCQAICTRHAVPSQCAMARPAPPAQPAPGTANNICHSASRTLSASTNAISTLSRSKIAGLWGRPLQYIMVASHQCIHQPHISQELGPTTSSSSTALGLTTVGCQCFAQSVMEQHKRTGAAACTSHTCSSMSSNSRHHHRRHHPPCSQQQLIPCASVAKAG